MAEQEPHTVYADPADDSWLHTFLGSQRRAVEAHLVYQKAMTDTHLAFLRIAEAWAAGPAGTATGQRPATQPQVQAVSTAPLDLPPASAAPAANPVSAADPTPTADACLTLDSATPSLDPATPSPDPATLAANDVYGHGLAPGPWHEIESRILVAAGARATPAQGRPPAAAQAVPATAPKAALAEPRTGTLVREIQLNSRSHPYLADHDIAGTPIVPIALVLEWFTATARAWLRDTGPVTVRGLNVLRKLELEGFQNGGDRLAVHGSRNTGDRLILELLGAKGAKHYRASAGPASASASAGAGASGRSADWTVPVDLEPSRRPRIYDGYLLFHGPRFQAIQAVQGVSSSGAAGVLNGIRELGWGGDGWHTDPATVDGGLQLAGLWAEHVLSGASLPMSVQEYRAHHQGSFDGPTRCVVRAGTVRTDEAQCDIAFLGEDGSIRAELLGVSLVRRPA